MFSLVLAAVAAAAVLAGCPTPAAPVLPLIPPRDAEKLALPPPDPARWLGPPLTDQAAAGHVTLLEVWTFACEHCRASHPWVADAARRHPGLLVLAVHTPQTDAERAPAAVAAFARKNQITWPIYIDTDARYFERVRAQGWPTFILIDKAGRLRLSSLGRAEPGRVHARSLDRAIADLQREP